MDVKLVLLLALVAIVTARPQDDNTPAKYEFQWAVEDEESANDFGHNESRDGDLTEGSYYVLLPDGRRLEVTYTVNGEGGFEPVVLIDGVPLKK
ncbi:pro-resilin-like [Oratosquilla oratoria]|uniref:pro-resilin-like n=1 Tax=Oratosquilla oratoria TaxID=337810 RepID=UPI003F765B03